MVCPRAKLLPGAAAGAGQADAVGLSLSGCSPCLPDDISEVSCVLLHSKNTYAVRQEAGQP